MQYNLGAFVPDKLPTGDILVECVNVFPAENGYRAAPSFSSISSPLPDTFLGAASFKSGNGTATLLVGTASTLSRLSGGAWTGILTGLSVSGRWRFTQFGNSVIAVNGTTTQEVDLSTQTAAALSGAPTAIDVAVVGDHVVLAQPNGEQLKVRWSAFGDSTGWTNGTNQAGEQIMLAGGEVMGVVGGEYGVILQRNRLVRMDLTGDADAPFNFDPISENFGCASKASIAAAGRTIFYLSDRGFAALESGQDIRLVGNEKFDRSFTEALGSDGFERLYSAIDPERSIVFWGIPGLEGQIWGYNWALDRAFVLELPFDGIFAGFENSTDLETLAATVTDLDAATISFDDPRYSGGAPRLYAVQNGEVGNFAGANMTARFVTGEVEPSKGRKTRVRAVWPDTDATGGVTVKLNAQQRRGDTGTLKTASVMQPSGRMALQANGRYFECTMQIADSDWSYVQGFEFEANAGAVR
jgi:hypothetical protein